MAFIRRIVLQKFRQRDGSSLMHRRADDGFDGLQVKVTGLTTILKDDAKQPVYFAGNFLLDRFSRFFSWDNGAASSTGRRRQI